MPVRRQWSPAGDTNTITTSGAKGVDATGAGTSLDTASVIDDLTVTDSTNGAVNLAATTGTASRSLAAPAAPSRCPARSTDQREQHHRSRYLGHHDPERR